MINGHRIKSVKLIFNNMVMSIERCTQQKFFLLLGVLAVLVWGCKPCNSCDDPKLVKVPAVDPSPPAFHWEMSQTVSHSNGTVTSNISIVPGGTTIVNSTAADSVTTTVYLAANDPESGVQCIYIQGGFGLTCMNSDSMVIAIDGILKSQSQCVDLTTCCLKDLRIEVEDLGSSIHCPDGRTLSSGGVGLTGIIVNCKGMQDTVNLTVQF